MCNQLDKRAQTKKAARQGGFLQRPMLYQNQSDEREVNGQANGGVADQVNSFTGGHFILQVDYFRFSCFCYLGRPGRQSGFIFFLEDFIF